MGDDDETVWKLDCRSQEFCDGPVVWQPPGSALLQYDYESETGEYAWSELAFSGVRASRFTAHEVCSADAVRAYDRLVVVSESTWAREVAEATLSDAAELRHFRIYFDTIGCYEFVAVGFEAREQATPVDDARRVDRSLRPSRTRTTTGFESLLAHWVDLVRAVEAGYRFSLDDYLYELSSRDHIAAVIDGSQAVFQAGLRSRVAPIDERFELATEPAAQPVGHFSGEPPFWRSRIPSRRGGQFANDLSRAGFAAVVNEDELAHEVPGKPEFERFEAQPAGTPSSPERHAPTVKLMVRNDSVEPTDLVLEPRGEIYPVPPGEARDVLYLGDPAPTLSIDIGDGELKIWEEGSGYLELQKPDGGKT